MYMSKKAKQLAKDLGISETDAVVMELKAKLYIKAGKAIKDSKSTHEEIAKALGTSRARITRISNQGENSLSIELLIKIITLLENKIPIKLAS